MKGIKDNKKLNSISEMKLSFKKVLIVGGGPSVEEHASAIQKYLDTNKDILIIHASSKNARVFKDLQNKQIFSLVGNEGVRLEEVFHKQIPSDASCILPAYPRKMGTYIPEKLTKNAFELNQISFSSKYQDTHTAIALQSAIEVDSTSVEIVGYDGYSGYSISGKEQELFMENETLFRFFQKLSQISLISLTPTVYKELSHKSIYTKI